MSFQIRCAFTCPRHAVVSLKRRAHSRSPSEAGYSNSSCVAQCRGIASPSQNLRARNLSLCGNSLCRRQQPEPQQQEPQQQQPLGTSAAGASAATAAGTSAAGASAALSSAGAATAAGAAGACTGAALGCALRLHLRIPQRLHLRQPLLFLIHAHRDELDHRLRHAQTPTGESRARPCPRSQHSSAHRNHR